MGYMTEFKGELKFTTEMTGTQLAEVKSFCDADIREHPEWGKAKTFNYFFLTLLDDFSGLKWNGVENARGMVEQVNIITLNMCKRWPDFGLTGRMLAQGEYIDDRWELVVEDGVATKEDVAVTGTRIMCPCCNETFAYEGE